MACLIALSNLACTGPAGEPGQNGTNGIDGLDGTNGTNGANGEVGAQGPQGEAGPEGLKGETGEAGPQGEAGPAGTPGANGEDLTHCLVGDGSIEQNYVVEYCEVYTTITTERVQWKLVGSFQSSPADCNVEEDECKGYAEVPAYDAESKRAFVVNATDNSLDIIDLSNPHAPVLFSKVAIREGEPNSVAVSSKGLVGVAVANSDKQLDGMAMFFTTDGTVVGQVSAGALPDMLTFTNDGNKALLANEGEPNQAYDNDPQGSVTVVDVSNLDVANPETYSNLEATQVDFTTFDDRMDEAQAIGIRAYGPEATLSQDLEPEYIAVSADDASATIVLQENNAVARLDLTTNTITALYALGFKDYSNLSFDFSDTDNAANFKTGYNVRGMYQPDALASFVGNDGETYYISANEGEARNYEGYSEATRVGNEETIILDETAFPEGVSDDDLARLQTTTAQNCGDIDADGDLDFICSYGARSFSIWKYDNFENFLSVWDSGDQIERLMAVNGQWLNEYNGTRNDDKGAEPEGVVTGQFLGRTLAFIALERASGILVYDVTDPTAPEFMQFIYMHDHVSPEAMTFVSSSQSPNGSPMLVVANEVSGTVAILQPIN
tara:strand:+ start:1198 stop:3024 length:1827 start_codon:yes stop_codon:yes gene_type:complete